MEFCAGQIESAEKRALQVQSRRIHIRPRNERNPHRRSRFKVVVVDLCVEAVFPPSLRIPNAINATQELLSLARHISLLQSNTLAF